MTTSRSKKGVYGIGINDADYPTQVGGKPCPYYLKWKTMLLRVVKKPFDCYLNVSVCEEWLTFSNFKEWMEAQDWVDKHLDKDILGDGSLYSPNTCCFITPLLNSFVASEKKKGKYLLGVDKNYNRYFSRCTIPGTGLRETLGRYNCEVAAHLAYRRRKLEHAREIAKSLEEPIASALIRRYTLDGCTGLGQGSAGALDFNLESFTLTPVDPPKEPKTPNRKDDF